MTDPRNDPMFGWLDRAVNDNYQGQQAFDRELDELGVVVADEEDQR